MCVNPRAWILTVNESSSSSGFTAKKICNNNHQFVCFIFILQNSRGKYLPSSLWSRGNCKYLVSQISMNRSLMTSLLFFAHRPWYAKYSQFIAICWGMFLFQCNNIYRLGTSLTYSFGPRREKTGLRWFAKSKGVDQPAHPRSLISAFVIRLLKSMISKLASNELSVF